MAFLSRQRNSEDKKILPVAKNLITCEITDYFELVCVRHSNVTVRLDNALYRGEAVDLITRSGQQLLLIDTKNGQVEIDLEDVIELIAEDNSLPSHNFKLTLGQ